MNDAQELPYCRAGRQRPVFGPLGCEPDGGEAQRLPRQDEPEKPQLSHKCSTPGREGVNAVAAGQGRPWRVSIQDQCPLDADQESFREPIRGSRPTVLAKRPLRSRGCQTHLSGLATGLVCWC